MPHRVKNADSGRFVPVLVVGGGAAGLWAAGALARGGLRPVLLEKTARLGTKILASGGGRCNLTTALGWREAARAFGEAERWLRPCFAALPPEAVRAHFERLGVPTVHEPRFDKIFTRSGRALEVRDALVREARSAGAVLLCEQPVEAIEPVRAPAAGGARWRVHTPRGCWRCAHLVLAAGGASVPRTGTTGAGYRWLAALGLEVIEPLPALVPLRSPAPWVHELAGLRIDDAQLRLLDSAGRVVARRRRPVLFTHRGVSGPGPMDLSAAWQRARAASGRAPRLLVDLVPDFAEPELLAQLDRTRGALRLSRTEPMQRLPRRLRAVVARRAGLADPNPALAQLARRARHTLVQTLKGLEIPISGTEGWARAEVTDGGLALGEVDRRTMEVRRYPGLYVVGELLAPSGPIGGFSFQLAFATAQAAADAIVQRLGGQGAGR